MTVEVTQEDREAAASNILSRLVFQHGGEQQWMDASTQSMRLGEQDAHWEVQAFARHRIEATRASDARIAELEKAIKVQASAVRSLQANEQTEINMLRRERRTYGIAVSSLGSELEANAILTDENEALVARIAELEARVERLEEALAPSAGTKAAYMSEFSWTTPDFDECGGRTVQHHVVPWTTIKEIMAAIRNRAALGDK